jgi:hypothetical protein
MIRSFARLLTSPVIPHFAVRRDLVLPRLAGQVAAVWWKVVGGACEPMALLPREAMLSARLMEGFHEGPPGVPGAAVWGDVGRPPVVWLRWG